MNVDRAGHFYAHALVRPKQWSDKEASAPTEECLSGIPELADYSEDGMDALGIDVAQAEDYL